MNRFLFLNGYQSDFQNEFPKCNYDVTKEGLEFREGGERNIDLRIYRKQAGKS